MIYHGSQGGEKTMETGAEVVRRVTGKLQVIKNFMCDINKPRDVTVILFSCDNNLLNFVHEYSSLFVRLGARYKERERSFTFAYGSKIILLTTENHNLEKLHGISITDWDSESYVTEEVEQFMNSRRKGI